MSTARLLVMSSFVISLCACASDGALTQVIVVRHAEKADQSKDPDLSPVGEARALALAAAVREANVRAIYATQFKRTQATVKPLVASTGLPLVVVEAGDTAGLAARIKAEHRGELVLVAAHSNTIPELIKALGVPATEAIEPLADDAYDNFFVVTITDSGHASVLRLKYVVPAGP